MSFPFYRRYVGDYVRDTGHLSVMEHGAYTLLLDLYYARGKGLENNLPDLCRTVRATDEAEVRAIEKVTKMYFPAGSDGLLHNKRADRELREMAKWHRALANSGRKGGETRASRARARLERGLSEVEAGAKQGSSISRYQTPDIPPTPQGGSAGGGVWTIGRLTEELRGTGKFPNLDEGAVVQVVRGWPGWEKAAERVVTEARVLGDSRVGSPMVWLGRAFGRYCGLEGKKKSAAGRCDVFRGMGEWVGGEAC